jgi:hypothetical protein
VPSDVKKNYNECSTMTSVERSRAASEVSGRRMATVTERAIDHSEVRDTAGHRRCATGSPSLVQGCVASLTAVVPSRSAERRHWC